MIFSNIQNLLENANTGSETFTDLEPICESHITPDASGLGEIVLESVRNDNRLEEAVMEAEHQLMVCEASGNLSESKMIELQEAVIGDVFGKIVQGFKDLYQKIVGFFKKLFASLGVMSGDVKKSLAKAEKYLNKNFSEYTYTGLKWKSSDIASKMSSNLTKSISTAEVTVKSYLSLANSASADSLKDDANKREDAAEERISLIVGSSVNTLEEARRVIIDAYLDSETPESIKGFSVESKDNMLAFLKNFEKNKVLTKLRDDTIKEYQKVVTLAEKTKNEIEKVKSKYSTKGKESDVTDKANKNMSTIVTNAKTQLMMVKSNLNIYNTLMGECITLEKKKFGDYKKAISGAVSFSPKKAD